MKAALIFGLCLASNLYATEVEIPAYFGEEALKASVSAEGIVEIKNYPTEWPARLELVQFSPAGIFPDLSEQTCKDIGTQTKQYPLLPPLARERVREIVRRSNPVLARMDVAERFQPHRLIPALRQALKATGQDPQTLVLKNRIAIQEVKFRVTVEPTAISRNIGEIHSVELALADQYREGIIRMGVMPADVAAMDLLCDLKSGKARIEVDVTAAQSDVSEARSILPPEKAKALVELFNEERARFSTGSHRADFGKNRIVATAMTLDHWKNDFDLALVIERLTDPRTGFPLRFTEEALKEATTIIVTSAVPFKASAIIQEAQ